MQYPKHEQRHATGDGTTSASNLLPLHTALPSKVPGPIAAACVLQTVAGSSA
jgi:hypothetical protein